MSIPSIHRRVALARDIGRTRSSGGGIVVGHDGGVLIVLNRVFDTRVCLKVGATTLTIENRRGTNDKIIEVEGGYGGTATEGLGLPGLHGVGRAYGRRSGSVEYGRSVVEEEDARGAGKVL
jgi:hypothetical protein